MPCRQLEPQTRLVQDGPPQDEAPHMDQRISWLCSHVVGQDISEPQGHAGPDGVPATYSHTVKAKDPALDAAAPGGKTNRLAIDKIFLDALRNAKEHVQDAAHSFLSSQSE